MVIVRKGKEETRKVTLGRLEDGEKPKQAAAEVRRAGRDKPVVQKALGLDLANARPTTCARSYKIKDSVKGGS